MDGGRRFRFDFAPYQREMMETPYREDVSLTVYQLASRMGKTEVISNIIGHSICERPRRILVMYPTISQTEKWSKETLMAELVNPTPDLAALLGDDGGRRKSGNTITHKLFPGGVLNAFGSNAPGEMRRAKGNLLCADEIDAIEFAQSDEGDPLEIFWVRGSEYPDTIKIAASYPSVRGHSKIESLLLQSDYRVMIYECPKCSEGVILTRKLLRYDPHKPEDAWLECPNQGCKITDAQRIKMIQSNDKWTPTKPFTGIAGFQGSRMMSPHPPQKGFKSHLHWAAVEELKIEKAENREKAKRVLVNTFDGETYEPPEEAKPDPIGLLGECYDYLSAVGQGQIGIPAGVLVITMGADVQGDRIETEFVGFGLNGQTWGLGYHILPGNTLEPEVWQKLDKLTLQEFIHPSGKILKPACVMVDSKYRMEHVRAFTLPRQARGVFPVVGSTIFGKPIVSEPKKSGRSIYYEIGTHEAKALIYQNATLRRDQRSSELPCNYMSFSSAHGYSEEYFRRLLIEDVELKKASDGNFYQFFSNPNRLRNEPLDVRVYAMGGERKLKPAYGIIAKKLLKTEDSTENNSGEMPPNRNNFVLG